jgi:hypothetical protein
MYELTVSVLDSTKHFKTIWVLAFSKEERDRMIADIEKKYQILNIEQLNETKPQ